MKRKKILIISLFTILGIFFGCSSVFSASKNAAASMTGITKFSKTSSSMQCSPSPCIKYKLPVTNSTASYLYPTNSTLAEPYQSQNYSELYKSIEYYTLQTLNRDFSSDSWNISVSAYLDSNPNDNPEVTIKYAGSDLPNNFLENFMNAHQALVTSGKIGLDIYNMLSTSTCNFSYVPDGTSSCITDGTCSWCTDGPSGPTCKWCNSNCGVSTDQYKNGCSTKYTCTDWPTGYNCQPWSLFLPLGMPIVSQKVVNLGHYPPAVSLKYGDYWNNATMREWSTVLKAAGISDYTDYESIIDGLPIAAPGSNVPLPGESFFEDYMLGTASAVGGLTALTDNFTKAVVVWGTPGKTTWEEILQNPNFSNTVQVTPASDSVPVLGQTTVQFQNNQSQTFSFIEIQHPDVSLYDCCKDQKLIQPVPAACTTSKTRDLASACVIKKLGAAPSTCTSANDPQACLQKLMNDCENSVSPSQLTPVCKGT